MEPQELKEVVVAGSRVGPCRQLELSAQGFMRSVAGGGGEELQRPALEAQKMLESLSFKSLADNGRNGHTARRVVRVRLEWRGLTYNVREGRRRSRTWRTVLQNVSGSVPPGRLLAVLGPTGCGKTSLLNALAARLPAAGGELLGEVLLNGRPRGRGFRSIAGYVMQEDVLYHNLTVRETLEFAAAVALPARSVPAEARRALVGQVIAELGLAKAEHTYIGNAFVRGVSGGERKRVSIGLSLLANPSLLFLDEPTSGLDATQALNVMEALWGLAHSGRSVVATVHQPRSSIFSHMFDLLLLMSEGRTMFFGPAGQSVEWFASWGFPCPPHYNPADFMLDLVSLSTRSAALEAESRHRVELLAEAFEQEGAAQYAQQAEADTSAATALHELDRRRARFANSLPTEFLLLLRRAWKQQSRDRLPQAIAIIQSIVIGLILAALYSDMPNNQTGIQDEIGIVFFICIFSAFNALFGALNTFPTDRSVVNRERASKSYRMLPFYLARFICDMPLRVGQGLLFGVIVYFIVGLNPAASAFFIFVALLVMEGLASQGLGIAVSAACKNEKVAMAVAPAVTVILFGGFYIQKDSIPGWLRWLEYLSHMYYAFMGLVINNFRGRTGWECGSTNGSGSTGPACITTGNEVVARLGFGGNELWQAFLGLGCLIFGYNGLGYLALRLSRQRFLPLNSHKGAAARASANGSSSNGNSRGSGHSEKV